MGPVASKLFSISFKAACAFRFVSNPRRTTRRRLPPCLPASSTNPHVVIAPSVGHRRSDVTREHFGQRFSYLAVRGLQDRSEAILPVFRQNGAHLKGT